MYEWVKSYGQSTVLPAACKTVQAKLQGLQEAINTLCGEETNVTLPTVRSTWKSVAITHFGHTNLRHRGTFSYVIPSVIPSTANNVLIYVTGACGHAPNHVVQHIKIFTQDGSDKHYEKYLYVESYRTVAANTNSENMWFPMPTSRRVFVVINGSDVGSNYCTFNLHVVGYN